MLGSDIAVSVLFGLVLPDRQSICAQSLQSFELLCSYLAEWDAKPSIPVVHLGRHLLTLFVPGRNPLTCIFHLSIQKWTQRNISLDTSLNWMNHLSLQQPRCLLPPHQAICHCQPILLSPTSICSPNLSIYQKKTLGGSCQWHGGCIWAYHNNWQCNTSQMVQ